MMRDAAVLPDSATGTYYIVSSARVQGGGVRAYASKDLVNWEMLNYAYDTLGDNDALTLDNGQNSSHSDTSQLIGVF